MSDELLGNLLGAGEPAGLGPAVRAGVLSPADAEQAAAAACASVGVDGPRADCVHALVLLWNDHLDRAHGLVQDLSGADAAWVHGIMHRREPDFSNAQYWFHRVGRHAAFAALATGARAALGVEHSLNAVLVPDGRWDPMAFIREVERATRARDAATESVLRTLQRAEFMALGHHLLGA
ncbi:MAG: hypothetical protein IT580_08425 [Verrucomicrobiales bacterium]|nr:hypothetical protein [Verrucomicrobiales bacterium]